MSDVLRAQAEEKLVVEEGERQAERERLFRWWRSWEVYLILALAIGLRLYRINTAEYMTDHNTFYQMAHDAVANGLWPISANRSSTGPLIPPLFVYIMMIPAMISPNPIAGNIFMACCNCIAVLLSYVFVRRYFGRLAGTVTALLYATAVNVIIFSRDIWQPDLLPLFSILLFFMLFRGGVDRKRNWFLPALLLLGAMYQFHSTAIYLVVPLGLAILFAFKTIRWRELLLTGLGLLLLFAPFIYLEFRNQFADLSRLLAVANHTAAIDVAAFQFYGVFVQSFVANPLHQHADTHLIPGNRHSVLLSPPLSFIAQFSQIESWLMVLLVASGALLVIALLVQRARVTRQRKIADWWRDLIALPMHRGLLLLLAWQGTILLFVRHPTFVYIHYLIYLLPGPFIFIGLVISYTVKRLKQSRLAWPRFVRYGVYGLVGVGVVVQMVGSAGWLVDRAHGNFNSNYALPEYFDLASVQRIVDDVDRVAREQHLSRAYIDVHGNDLDAVRYLAQFVQTQIVTADSQQCVVLPAAQSGPVVYVTEANRADVDSILHRYTIVHQVGEIEHSGGLPFKLYVLSARAESQPSLQLSNNVQLSSQHADVLSVPGSKLQLVATRWSIRQTQRPQPRTAYNYSISQANERLYDRESKLTCQLSRTWVGDQFVPLFEFSGLAPHQLVMQASEFSSGAQHYDLGALKLVTFDNVNAPPVTLHTRDGNDAISVST